MPSGLKRFQRAESLHFITFSCFHRLPLAGCPCLDFRTWDTSDPNRRLSPCFLFALPEGAGAFRPLNAA